MTDDFFIEDVLHNLSKKKQKVNSKDKGQRGERDLCKILTNAFETKEGFSRTIGSGNRWSQANLTEQAKEVFAGDLCCPSGFKFTIESKYGYEGIDLCNAFEGGSKELDAFLAQAEKDAERINKSSLLCWRKPRKPWLAIIKHNLVKDYQFAYFMQYRDWLIVSLSELLKYKELFFEELSS